MVFGTDNCILLSKITPYYIVNYIKYTSRNPDAAYIYTWPTAEPSMRRARRNNVPALPDTLNALGEMLDENQHLVKCNDHQFYQDSIVDDLGKCHIMFACPEVINQVVLNGGTEMHADATFKVVPSIPKCYQLFIIHMVIQNHVRSFYFNSAIP